MQYLRSAIKQSPAKLYTLLMKAQIDHTGSEKLRNFYQFSKAALTNYHKLGSLKQQKFTLSSGAFGSSSIAQLTP